MVLSTFDTFLLDPVVVPKKKKKKKVPDEV